MTAATAKRRDGETARWQDGPSATRSRLDRHARTRPRRRRRPPAKRRLLEVWPFGSTGASAQRVVVGGEEGVDRFVKTVLLGARWCVTRDLVDVRRRVIREVATRLLATQGFLACLSDEAIFYEHYKQREAEVRRDSQQAVCGFKLRLVEIVRARKLEIEGRGRLWLNIQPAKGDLTHATRSLLKPGLVFF